MLHEQLPPLDFRRIAALRFRERRQRERIVEHECRLHEFRLDAGLEDFVNELGAVERSDVGGGCVVTREHRAQIGIAHAIEIDTGILLDQRVIVLARERAREGERGTMALEHRRAE